MEKEKKHIDKTKRANRRIQIKKVEHELLYITKSEIPSGENTFFTEKLNKINQLLEKAILLK